MQSQKLPLWQLFLFPCAKQRYQPPSRQPKYSAHIRSGIPPVRQSRPHRCGRLPFFSAGASLRGTTLPGDPLILRQPHSFPENPDPSPESLLFGKPLGLEADIRTIGRHQVYPRRLGRYVADDIDAPHAHHLLLQGQRHREQQFVVFTAVERRHDRVGISSSAKA